MSSLSSLHIILRTVRVHPCRWRSEGPRGRGSAGTKGKHLFLRNSARTGCPPSMAWSVRSSVPARPDSCDAWSPARPKLNLFLEFAGATENVVSATADTRQDTRQHTQFASERTGASGRECERGAESQHATELRRLKDATTVHTGTQHTTRAISSQSEPPSSIDHFVCTGSGVCTAALRTQETSKRNPSGE